MQIDKLIPMNAFVLAEDQFISQFHTRDARTFEPYNRIVNYAKFLTQPLTLGMFVPCDDEGNVIEEPESRGVSPHYILGPTDEEARLYDNWAEAKSKVLFEGFTMCDRGDKTCVMTDTFHINGFMWQGYTIEKLLQYDLQLTPTAKTLIYGR